MIDKSIGLILLGSIKRLNESMGRLSEISPAAMSMALGDEANRELWLGMAKEMRAAAYDIERLVAGPIH